MHWLRKWMTPSTKVFGIGFNKTGTTTLEAVFRLYDLRVPPQDIQETRTTKATFDGDYKPLKRLVSKFDAFQDLPFSQGEIYKVVDKIFPHSKFILTERDPAAWFESLRSFHQRMFQISDFSRLTEQDVKEFNYLYNGYVHETFARFLTCNGEIRWDLLYDKEYYIKQFNDRNAGIREHFELRPHDLLVVDVSQERDTAKIGGFLGFDRPPFPMPRENVTAAATV